VRQMLDPTRVVDTIEALSRRIEQCFPGSGLGAVATEVLDTGRDVPRRAARIRRPNRLLRLAVVAVVAALLAALSFGLAVARPPDRSFSLTELVEVSEAGMNVLVLIGGAVLFLVTAESRLRRGRALAAIGQLRELAHVVDMHQLAKDPQLTLEPHLARPSDRPQAPLDAADLAQYLDYCSEMFSLIGKLAAVYAQQIDDAAVIAAVNEVEGLTTGLSRKIWQKLIILQAGQRPAPLPAPQAAS
jgi:hypothetical protein